MNNKNEKRIMMQRIAFQGIVSFNLLNSGYLIYGWSELMSYANKKNIQIRPNVSLKEIEKIGIECYGSDFIKWRNRYNVEKFFNYNIGDLVIIPKYKSFDIYRITDMPCSLFDCNYIKDVLNVTTEDGRSLCFDDSRGILIDGDSDEIDIGMIVRVEKVYTGIDKDYATTELQSKFKYRGAFLDLTDCKDLIDKTILNYEQKKPVSLYNSILELLNNYNWYSQMKNPDKLEILIMNLMNRLGADESTRPSKNESGKSDYADCDVFATFNSLGVQYLIQCKNHDGKETDEEWAIDQIVKYSKQKKDILQDNYTTVLWVVSMSQDFSEKTKNYALAEGVRLINQRDLIEMLINSGWTNRIEIDE